MATNFTTQVNFLGRLDDHSVKDFLKLDYDIKKLDDRREYLNNLLESSEFFNLYFDNYFKANITGGDALSEDVNICKILERMANYLLNSDDVKEEDKKNKPVYVFHKNNERFEQKLNREKISVTNDNEEVVNLVDNENVVHSLEVPHKNSRKPKVQQITKKDLMEDSLCGSILREYQQFLDYVNEKLHEEPDKNWRYYSNAKAQIKDDMINVKDMLNGVWGYNIQIKESHLPDLDIFDFTNEETVRYMISLAKPNFYFNFEMWVIWQDFQDIVKKAKLTKQEQEVYSMIQDGYKLIDISYDLGIEYQRLKRTTIMNIVRKIIKVGCRYDAEDEKIKEKIIQRRLKAKEENEEV